MPLLVLWLHLLAAMTWIGGMLFIALVLMPVTRGLNDRALRTELVQATGRRFRTVAWVALVILLATGLVNLWFDPFLLHSPRLHWKLGLVGLALVLGAIHDFVVGPRAGLATAAPSARVYASWLARINVLVAVVIVLLGLSLFR